MLESPELLFPDDGNMDSPLPGRPLLSPQPIGKKSLAVAPSDRRMDWSPGGPPRGFRGEHVAPSDRRMDWSPGHVAITVKPAVPTIFVPRARPIASPSIPGFYDPTGRKLRTSPSAFRINPDSIVKSPLRRTKKAGRGRRTGKLTRHRARASYSRKASRPSTRGSLRR